jgi:hypothetical protein
MERKQASTGTSCVQWCKYARECAGEETYHRLTMKKPEEHQS